MAEITEELQALVLSSIIKNTYFYSKVSKLLKPQFFNNINYRIILEKVKYHYNKYGNVPTQQALLTYLNDMDDIVDKSALKLDAINLYTIPDDESEEYLIDKITNFIKVSNIQDVISSYLPKIKNGEEVSIEKLGTELSKSVDIDMNSQGSLTLSNFQQLEEARKNAIGNNSDPTIIKSSLEPVNHSLMFGGYKYGDLVAFIAAPGCFTGDTEVILPNGTVKTFEELYKSNSKNIGVYSSNKEGNVEVSCAESVYLSDYVDKLCVVEIDNNHKIKCTVDHPFMLRDGLYKRADKLQKCDVLMSFNRFDKNCNINEYSVNRVDIIELNTKVPVYGLVEVKGNHNYAISVDSTGNNGVIVSNTGKTSILVNEGAAAAKQGNEVLHLFIGDMNNYDGWIRYCSCLTNVPQTDLVAMGLEQQIQFIKDYNKMGYMTHITVQDVPAESTTVDQLIKTVKELQRKNKVKYDMIIVDYPDNLVGEGDNMYLSGGTIYNKLSGFGAKNRSVILLASQPKISYYSSEIIPLEGAAESSKKQQNLDLMVTFGKPYRDFPYLTGFIPKCRRGEVGRKFRVKTEFERMRAEEVSEVQYHSELNAYLGSQGGN